MLAIVFAGVAIFNPDHALLKIEPPIRDLGKVMGNSAKCEFLINNPFAVELNVKVLKSCGCTDAKIDQPILKPGATAKLVALVDLRGRSGPFSVWLTLLSTPRGSDTAITDYCAIYIDAVATGTPASLQNGDFRSQISHGTDWRRWPKVAITYAPPYYY
jgi:hypothetical protein